jgi:hypothetical protein
VVHKGFSPLHPQVVEQQATGLTIWGGQESKGFETVAATSTVHDRMPVILDADSYSKVKEDVEFRGFAAEQAGPGFHTPTVAPKLPVAPIAPKTAGAEIALTA